MRALFYIVALAGGACSASAMAQNRDAASSEIRISGIVPTICRIGFSESLVSPDLRSINLGQMSQFCNDGAGYRVTLSYSDAFANARFVSNEGQVLLGAGGETVISDRDGPRWQQDFARIEFDRDAPQNLVISVRIEPKGAIY